MAFTRVRGTQDILDLKWYNFLIGVLGKHVECYNFSQIETPILELTSLFVRSLGQETDVVTKEMYVFETSKGESICLRPEGTAGTMRAYLENSIESKPWKVWSHGPMFRHERPQKGRWRQFTQFNLEVINAESIAHDAYFLKMLDLLFSQKLFLENYVIKLNFLGCSADRDAHRKAMLTFLNKLEQEICATCLMRKEKNLLRIFDCKNEHCQKIYADAPKIIDFLCEECTGEWKQLRELLDHLAVNVVLTPSLVRGLDYYEKTVFEFCSQALGAQNAFCAGGRYELGKALGAKQECPSLGAAIGLGRLQMLLEAVEEKLCIPEKSALHLILPMSQEQQALALLLADTLHKADLCVDVILDGGSMKSMMRKANKMGAASVYILGEDEQRDGTVSVKDMVTGKNVVIKQVEVIDFIKLKGE